MYSKRWLTPLQEILLRNFPLSSCRDILTHTTPCENKYVQNELGELLGKEEKCSLPVRAQCLSLPGAQSSNLQPPTCLLGSILGIQVAFNGGI